jgi:hypothetical protein
VVVWACLDEDCIRHVGSSYRWTYFEVTNAALTDPETVDVRVVVRDHGRVLFDHATRLVELDEWQPNGPGCEPTFFSAGVQATPEGGLIQQLKSTFECVTKVICGPIVVIRSQVAQYCHLQFFDAVVFCEPS